jgi:hypothetical protein
MDSGSGEESNSEVEEGSKGAMGWRLGVVVGTDGEVEENGLGGGNLGGLGQDAEYWEGEDWTQGIDKDGGGVGGEETLCGDEMENGKLFSLKTTCLAMYTLPDGIWRHLIWAEERPAFTAKDF